MSRPTGRWSRDRGRAWSARGSAADRRRICVAPTDGSGVQWSAGGPNDDAGRQWSPDGSTLTFLSDRAAAGRFQLYALEADALGEARLLTTVDGVVEHHQWSPDGSTILMVVAGPAPNRPTRWARAPWAVRTRARIRRRPGSPRWSPPMTPMNGEPCGSWMPAAARRGRSAGRTSTSGKPPGAATTSIRGRRRHGHRRRCLVRRAPRQRSTPRRGPTGS